MEESRETYSEVLGVLLALGNKYIKKLPSTMIPYLMENCNRNNIPKIDKNKRIEEQKISEDARIYLTMIKLKYWCTSEEEKKEIIQILKNNEEQYQEILRQKYNSDNLFKKYNLDISDNKDEKKELADNMKLSKIEKKGFFAKLFDRIRRLFKSR